jgi:hypothetical protein
MNVGDNGKTAGDLVSLGHASGKRWMEDIAEK